MDLSLVGDAPPSHVGEPKAPARKRLSFHLTTVDAEMVQAVLKWARASLGTDSNCLWVDVHHVRYQSDGGTHDEDNLVTVCSVHHTLIHDGRLAVERRGDRLLFTFPDGRVVEVPLAPREH